MEFIKQALESKVYHILEPPTTPTPEGCITTTMKTEVEFRQLNIGTAYQKTMIIKSSKAFNKLASTVKTGIKFTIGIPEAIELGITTDVATSLDVTSQTEDYFEKHDENSVTYQDGWLQIFRHVKKTIRIGDYTAEINEEDHVDSVPNHDHENDEQLLERARAYIQRKFGHKQYNGAAKIIGEGDTYEITGKSCNAWKMLFQRKKSNTIDLSNSFYMV